jgi:hypothetical protein
LNSYEVRRFVSTFNVMFESMGLGSKDAANMSKGLTQLAYDMASFYNLKPAEAFQKITAGITGEIEPLKRLGILINETTVKAKAQTLGLVKEKEALTDLQKLYVRYKLIMEQTAKAQGDLERTGGSLTNQLRRAKSQLTELAIEIGKHLIPETTKAIKAFNKYLTENRAVIIAWGKRVYTTIGFAKDTMWSFISYIRTDWRQALGDALRLAASPFIAFGKSIVAIMSKVGNDMYNALVEPLMAAQKWLLKVGPKKPLRTLSAPATPQDAARRTEPWFDLKKKSVPSWGEVGTDITQIWKSELKGAWGKIGKGLTDSWDKNWTDYMTKLAAITEEAMKAIKSGALAKIPGVGAPGGGGAAPAGKTDAGKVGFVGLREAWKAMASGLEQKSLLIEQKKTKVAINNLEQSNHKDNERMFRLLEVRPFGSVGTVGA